MIIKMWNKLIHKDVIDLYINDKLNAKEIAERFNVHITSVWYHLNKEGVGRNRSETQILAHKNGRYGKKWYQSLKGRINSMQGKHHSEKTKAILREKRKGYMTSGGFKKLRMYGKNETKILDFVETLTSNKIERSVDLGEYIVDGYDRDNNVVYEVFENYHLQDKHIEKDKIRISKIKQLMKCNVQVIYDSSACSRRDFLDKVPAGSWILPQ